MTSLFGLKLYRNSQAALNLGKNDRISPPILQTPCPFHYP